MPNVASRSLSLHRALTFYDSFTTTDDLIGYVMVGRNLVWPGGDVPPAIYDTENTRFDTCNNFFGGKKITGNDVFLVIPRVNWTSGVVWTQYDDTSNTQHSSANSLYIYSSGGNVYKCLSNANGAISTIEPANNYTSDSGFIAPGDGYLWKYMYKVPTSSKFLTSAWMPVPTYQTPAYFGYANNLIIGAISRLVLTAGGSGYYSTNTTITVTGSGMAGNVTATVANGSVTAIQLVNRGSGYIRQNTSITVVGVGANAAIRTILSPYGGHGFNPARELGANSVMVSVKVGDVDSTEGGNITANNDFRQVGLWLAPHQYGSASGVASANANASVTMATQIILSAGPSYLADELVYQGGAVANARFSGYVTDMFTNAIQITGRLGAPKIGDVLFGVTSGTARTIVSFTNPDLDVESGDLVYTENRVPVLRGVGQAEWIKIVLRF